MTIHKIVKKSSEKDVVQPIYGLKYKHFSTEEIRHIVIHSGVKAVEKKIYDANIFINKYTDLMSLESQLSANKLEGKLIWYIINLVLYGRINLEIKALKRIRLNKKDFIKTTSPIVNMKFINKFKETALQLDYSIDTINAILITNLVKIAMYYQTPVDEISYKLRPLMNELKDNTKLLTVISCSAIANIL
ncbi:hypothetical protein [Brassicibacter mesophilus]|uniref:hypothetical protein n=1 Tax=Brassicibacter mesophilus TaxID=745119 RepID=UPI003D24E6A4